VSINVIQWLHHVAHIITAHVFCANLLGYRLTPHDTEHKK